MNSITQAMNAMKKLTYKWNGRNIAVKKKMLRYKSYKNNIRKCYSMENCGKKVFE